jgi:hypothetical protein
MCANCDSSPNSVADLEPAVRSISLADINALSTRNVARMKKRSLTVSEASVVATSAIHTTEGGGTFLATSSIADLRGDVTLTGSIGPLPVELHLTIKVDPAAGTVSVTLEVDKPIQLGPFTWIFKLGGTAKDAKGNLIGAQSITLSPDTPAFEATGIGSHFLCFLKCAGLAIVPILLECLPSLVGGPQGFIACVVGKAGSGAASIAACVAKCA